MFVADEFSSDCWRQMISGRFGRHSFTWGQSSWWRDLRTVVGLGAPVFRTSIEGGRTSEVWLGGKYYSATWLDCDVSTGHWWLMSTTHTERGFRTKTSLNRSQWELLGCAVLGMCCGMWRSLPCCCWPNLCQRFPFTCNTCKCHDLWSRCNQSQSQPQTFGVTDRLLKAGLVDFRQVKLQDLSQDWKGRACWGSDCYKITWKILSIYFKRTGLTCCECAALYTGG